MAKYYVNVSDSTLNYGDISIPIGTGIKHTKALSKVNLVLLQHSIRRRDLKVYDGDAPPGIKIVPGFVTVKFIPPKDDDFGYVDDAEETVETAVEAAEEAVAKAAPKKKATKKKATPKKAATEEAVSTTD